MFCCSDECFGAGQLRSGTSISWLAGCPVLVSTACWWCLWVLVVGVESGGRVVVGLAHCWVLRDRPLVGWFRAGRLLHIPLLLWFLVCLLGVASGVGVGLVGGCRSYVENYTVDASIFVATSY
jgi:hypothetical protein